MRGRAFVAGAIVLAGLRSAAACSSFGTADGQAGIEGGATPASPVDDARAPGDDASWTSEAGCGAAPFVGRFTRPDLLADGWDDIAAYGPQDQLSVAHAADASDGVLRVRSTTAVDGRGKVFYRDLDTRLDCLAFEVRFRIDKRPLGSRGIVTTVLRFASDHWVGLTFTPLGLLEVAQQTTAGDAYQALGRVDLPLGEWHVARIVYREGPVVHAFLDDAAIPLDLKPLYPFAGPNRFDVGVTYAAPESVIQLDIDEVRLF